MLKGKLKKAFSVVRQSTTKPKNLCLNDVDDKELLTLYSYYAAKYKKIEFANPDESQIFELGISISISTERIYRM